MGALNGQYKRPCAVCKTPVSAGMLMCLAHWRMAPRNLQREVNESWRAVTNRQAKSVEEVKERAARYRLAVEAAIEAVKARAS